MLDKEVQFENNLIQAKFPCLLFVSTKKLYFNFQSLDVPPLLILKFSYCVQCFWVPAIFKKVKWKWFLRSSPYKSIYRVEAKIASNLSFSTFGSPNTLWVDRSWNGAYDVHVNKKNFPLYSGACCPYQFDSSWWQKITFSKIAGETPINNGTIASISAATMKKILP